MKITITPDQNSIEDSLGISGARKLILQKLFEQTLSQRVYETSSECIEYFNTVAKNDNEAAYLIFLLGKMYGLDMIKTQLKKQGFDLISE